MLALHRAGLASPSQPLCAICSLIPRQENLCLQPCSAVGGKSLAASPEVAVVVVVVVVVLCMKTSTSTGTSKYQH